MASGFTVRAWGPESKGLTWTPRLPCGLGLKAIQLSGFQARDVEGGRLQPV